MKQIKSVRTGRRGDALRDCESSSIGVHGESERESMTPTISLAPSQSYYERDPRVGLPGGEQFTTMTLRLISVVISVVMDLR